MRTPRHAFVVVLAAALFTAGCATMPDSGPVVRAHVPSVSDDEQASDIDASPPRPGASPVEIAKGFLDAMTASPIRLDVAQQYLTDAAAAEWNPDEATITYADNFPPQAQGQGVAVSLIDANELNASGAWQGQLPTSEGQLEFHTVLEHGEFRISNPRNALIVPSSWFAQRFREISLFFFDRSAQILVPEPVFVPRGGQLASTLVGRLLEGPGKELRSVARTFVPRGLRVGLSIPVSPSGVADISLLGDAGPQTSGLVERMMAQLAWTMRQVPGISALRVDIGGEPVRLADGGTTYPVDSAAAYDPTGYDASTHLYALQQGVLKEASGAMLQAVAGPFSSGRLHVRSISVDLAGEQAAGISTDGRSVLVAPTTATGPNGGAAVAHRDVVPDATDLLPPAYDFTGRLWLVDRAAGRARISYINRGPDRAVHPLTIPGISGHDVTSFLVSRDGTRFAAVVRTDGADEVRIARIDLGDDNLPARASASVPLPRDQGGQSQIQSIGWTSSTTIAIASPVVPGRVYEIHSVAVDGSPTSTDALSATVSGRVVGIAGNPTPGQPQYAVTRAGLVDLSTGVGLTFSGSPPTSVDYVG